MLLLSLMNIAGCNVPHQQNKNTFAVSETRASEIDLRSGVYLQACLI